MKSILLTILSVFFLFLNADAFIMIDSRPPVAAGGGGPFTFITSVTGWDANSTITTVDASSSLNVAAGDLLVAWTQWQNANSADTIVVDQNDSTNTFTAGTPLVNSSDIGGQFSWLLSGPADATFTPRTTISNNSRRISIIVMQFRPDSGETVTLDAEGTPASGSSTSPASNNISTTGTDVVALGGVSTGAGGGASSEQVDGTAFDDTDGAAGGHSKLFHRILTATFTDGNATATIGNDLWVANVIAFKSVP